MQKEKIIIIDFQLKLWTLNKRTFYGFINNFFKLNDEIITKVDILEDESDNYNFNNLSQLTLKHLKKFIKKVKLSNTFVLVESNFII
jgi:hypothetical protein